MNTVFVHTSPITDNKLRCYFEKMRSLKEREREREREGQRERKKSGWDGEIADEVFVNDIERECVCLCVCVWKRVTLKAELRVKIWGPRIVSRRQMKDVCLAFVERATMLIKTKDWFQLVPKTKEKTHQWYQQSFFCLFWTLTQWSEVSMNVVSFWLWWFRGAWVQVPAGRCFNWQKVYVVHEVGFEYSIRSSRA